MSVVVAVAALVALGVLFALDPGGAIAESGFPDFREMDLVQLAVWGFRTIGVVAAQLIIIALWLWSKWQSPHAIPRYSGTPRPGSMPAAAVSTLRGHMVGSPTKLASIIEMCQRGTLRIEAVGTRGGFIYRLSRQGFTEQGWERTICDSLPSRPTTIDALREAIDGHEDAIGDQIGDYLQQRGFFHDNPVRVRRENSDDGGPWDLFACILTGVGSGLWAALWLDQWWANALIGAFSGLVYSYFAAQIRVWTGMLEPTPAGAQEIGQWLGWEESIARTAHPVARSQSDPMLPYAVALNVAQPWLDVSASAPPWFGSGGESSLQPADLDTAYHAFMHAPEWWLTGRSEDAAKAAAQWGYEEELQLLDQLEQLDLASPDAEQPEHTANLRTAERVEDVVSEPEWQRDSPAAPAGPQSTRYQAHRLEGAFKEEKSGGRLRGCFLWLASLVGIGVVVLAVLFSLDVVSPRDKPCPLNSPPIPTPAQIAVAGDLFRDGCVRVSGTLVSKEVDMLVLEIERGDYVQQVIVRVPIGPFEEVSLGKRLTLGGWLKVGEDGTYEVHFVPDRGSDREWWRNLRENFEALF